MQEIAILAHIEIGTVGGQTGTQRRRHLGDEGTANGGGAGQDDLRLVFADQVFQNIGVGLVIEMGQGGALYLIDGVGAMGDQGRGLTGQALTQEDRRQGYPLAVGDCTANSQELQGHRGQGAMPVLGKDPDSGIGGQINRGALSCRIYGQGAGLTVVNAGAAQGTFIIDHCHAGNDLNGAKGAPGLTDTATDTFFRVNYKHGY